MAVYPTRCWPQQPPARARAAAPRSCRNLPPYPVWNFRGELVSRFEDHALWFPLPEIDHTSVIYITQNQDVILSLCEESDGGDSHRQRGAERVSIHVSHILSGRCLAKIDWKSADPSNLTALYYNEERGDIITGNTQGLLHVWTN